MKDLAPKLIILLCILIGVVGYLLEKGCFKKKEYGTRVLSKDEVDKLWNHGKGITYYQGEIDEVFITNREESITLINLWADKYNWPMLVKDSNTIETGTPFYCNPDSFSVTSWYPLIHIWDSNDYLHTYNISKINPDDIKP